MTVVLPRRSYSALLGRLLHDRTADKIAAVVSRIPRSAATIIPYDVESRVRVIQERHAAKVAATTLDTADQRVTSEETEVAAKHGSAAEPGTTEPPGAADARAGIGAEGARPGQGAGARRGQRPALGFRRRRQPTRRPPQPASRRSAR